MARNRFAHSSHDKILARKFNQYLLPTIIMAIGASLNEFVDALVVSHLLGETAMAMVNMGTPLVLLSCAFVFLFGAGGSNIYGVRLGSHDREGASKVFSVTAVSMFAASIILCILCILGLDMVSSLLCKETTLLPEFKVYIVPNILNMPVMILSMGLALFFPAMGNPNAATAVSILANVANLILDFVYIRLFRMGVVGASLATVSGNTIGLIYILIFIWAHRQEFGFRIPIHSDFSLLRKTLPLGVAYAVSQLGLGINIIFSNYIAVTFAGSAALILLSVCSQIQSIVSIVVSGIVDTLAPILAVLNGQEDYKGIRITYYRSAAYMMIGVFAFFLLFVLRPDIATTMFNVTDENALAYSSYAIRAFSVGFLLRYGYYHYFSYLKTMGFSLYATAISSLNGFALQIPVILLLTNVYGIDGLWWGTAVTSVIIIIGILIVNCIIKSRNPEKYASILLFNKDTIPALYVSLSTEDGPSISDSVQKHVASCPGMDRLAARAAAICEDMVVYTSKAHVKYPDIDLMVKVKKDRIIMDFRSMGEPLDILVAPDPEQMDSLMLIRKASDEVLYDRILGINMTRLILHVNR